MSDKLTSEQIAEERADWLLDAVATATQDRRFLRGEPEYDAITGQAILQNGKKAIETAISRALATHPTSQTVKDHGND